MATNTTNETDSAISGGLLVVLGIVVAAGLGFLYFNGTIGGHNTASVASTSSSENNLEPAAGGASAPGSNSSTTTEKTTTMTTGQ